jgi:tRNA-specific 2-thiouridylase
LFGVVLLKNFLLDGDIKNPDLRPVGKFPEYLIGGLVYKQMRNITTERKGVTVNGRHEEITTGGLGHPTLIHNVYISIHVIDNRLYLLYCQWMLGISKSRVFVGLSGGVDSAVSAALLKEQGFDVTGVFIKVWSPDFLPCTWREERRDAMRVAVELGIPFLFFDFEEEYKKAVADKMISEYALGRTPNPDILCNREIKFGAFWKKAKELGADYIATGHYAQNLNNQLFEGQDGEKDQSYFLWTLTEEDLKHCLFPVGHLEKKEVRRLAEKFNIPVALKKDSQGICFLGDVDLQTFLPHCLEIKSGEVLNTKGEVIGRHKGAIYYTLGERHGFGITKNSPDSKAFYVVSKDMKANTITVSNEEQEIKDLSPIKIKVKDINLINRDTSATHARIRYRGDKVKIDLDGDTVKFESPQRGLSTGQSIVFYSGQECLGGAVVDTLY